MGTYTIDLLNYKVFEETKKYLKIENFLNIENMWGENEYFTIDVQDGVLEMKLWDNNEWSIEENIRFLLMYFNDIGTEMFNDRTLEV